MKSWTKPTPELISRAIASTIDAEQRRHLFTNLQNPLWAKPLWERGFFSKPPEPLPTGDGGIQMPLWPESQYLARIVKEVPTDVADIALRIQTNNSHVLEDMLDIALAIDVPDLSRKFYDHAFAFKDSPYTQWRYQKLGKLIVHWARLGAHAEALRLAHAVVSLSPDPQKREKEEAIKADPDSLVLLSRPEPRPRYDYHIFEKILGEDIKQLAEVLPWQTVTMLSKCLSDAITMSQLGEENQSSYDASDFWCRHVKERGTREDKPKGCLAHALTDACEILLQKEPNRFDELDGLLRNETWHFFSRLRWHLYSQFPHLSMQQMRTEALNYDNYRDGEYGYEFASMLRASSKAHVLDDPQLKGIFEQIETGPDIEGFKQWLGGKVSQEQIEARRGYFFTKQMFPFEDVLSRFPAYSNKYQALIEKHGVRNLADYFKFGEAKVFGVELRSPITAEALAAKSDEELLAFLNDWKPRRNRDDIDSPCVSGLSEVFSGLLKKQPERFLGIADRLRLPPTYVRDFLYFVKEIAKRREALPWEKIVRLCEWVVIQPNEPPREEESDWWHRWGDADFTECRRVTAELIKLGSIDYPESIPFHLRDSIFGLLKNLCSGYDRRLDESSHSSADLLTQAINSVRGEALHALVNHAFWVKRNLKILSGALKSMAEIQAALEERLNPSREKAPAVHAVFGFLTPSLLHLDREWFASVKSHIFPTEENHRDRWFASWTTYMSWNHANKLVFESLKKDYWIAVSEMESLRQDESHNRTLESLGEHLIILYGWGLIPLTGEDSLLQTFLAKASPKERAYVMNYAGRALENTETVPTEIRERLMAYWEFRLAAARHDEKPDEASQELSDFAWWVRSGKFEHSWCLTQLKALLNFVSKFPETMFLLEDLAKLAREYPKDVATCLQLIVRQIRSDRYLYLDEQHVKQILRAALSSNVPEAVKIAESTQDDLLRLGRFEFKDLTELVNQ